MFSIKKTSAIILLCFFASAIPLEAFAADVVLDIDANGSDGHVTLPEGGNLTVTCSLDPGSHAGEDADWWIWTTSPFGTYWFTLNSGWQPSNTPIRVYGGPLFSLSPYAVLNMSTLPVGDYVFNFSVDGNMDNVQDNTYADTVLVAIDPGGISTYKIPDTGQWQDYTDTFGEDSDYTINPLSYTDSDNGTVTDNNTGLMWQQQDGDVAMSWYDAVSYCEGLSLAGHSDWKLPEVEELTDIVNYGTDFPAIDEVYFPDTNSSRYWTSTAYMGNTDGAWYVYFYDGDVYYNDKLDSIYARCVRGGKITKSFNDNGDGTVTDNVTGLVWQQEGVNTTRDWESAITYCEGLSFADYNDWRLPNAKELKSIVDYNKSDPAIDETYFPDTNSSWYWSSTTIVGGIGGAWLVSFNVGSIDVFSKSYSLYTRCARGEGE